MVLAVTKTPPSPSLVSAASTNGSIVSFPMLSNFVASGGGVVANGNSNFEHSLVPLEEEKLLQQLQNCDPIRFNLFCNYSATANNN